MATMTGRTTPAPCPFTAREREYIGVTTRKYMLRTLDVNG